MKKKLIHILYILLIMFIFKPNDYEIKQELSSQLNPIMTELVQKELESYVFFNENLTSLLEVIIPKVVDSYTKYYTNYILIYDIGIFKLILDYDGTFLGIAFLENSYFILENEYEIEESDLSPYLNDSITI